MKILLLFLISVFLFPANSFSQDPDEDLSFMDKVQKLFELRRSFDTKSETSKPAELSFKKNENEDAVYKVDLALLYKGFREEIFGITPAVQLEYSSNPKNKQQKLKTSLISYFNFIIIQKGELKLEPAVSFTKDFFAQTETVDGKIYLIPRFPSFFIPVRNVSDIKFKYNGKDNNWIFGFNPVIGIEYRNRVGKKSNDEYVRLYNVFAGDLTLKRYYIELDVNGRYEKELEINENSTYKYGTALILYFDSKERASFNARFEREEKNKKKNTKISLGFGVKL